VLTQAAGTRCSTAGRFQRDRLTAVRLKGTPEGTRPPAAADQLVKALQLDAGLVPADAENYVGR